MRTSFVLSPLLLLVACSGKSEDVGGASGGQLATGGVSTAAGGVNSAGGSGGKVTTGTGGTAGSAASGGVATGGSAATSGGSAATSGGSAATSGGSAATSGGSAATSGGTQGLVDCDLRKVLCRIVMPVCPENQVPSVSGTCYGPCVPIESCACSVAAECPNNDSYTCWGRMHCGPYV